LDIFQPALSGRLVGLPDYRSADIETNSPGNKSPVDRPGLKVMQNANCSEGAEIEDAKSLKCTGVAGAIKTRFLGDCCRKSSGRITCYHLFKMNKALENKFFMECLFLSKRLLIR